MLPALANLQANGLGGVQIVSGGGNPAAEPGAVPYTQADVGKILTIAQGQGTLSASPELVLIPSAFLFVTVVALNVLGDALRERWAG